MLPAFLTVVILIGHLLIDYISLNVKCVCRLSDKTDTCAIFGGQSET